MECDKCVDDFVNEARQGFRRFRNFCGRFRNSSIILQTGKHTYANNAETNKKSLYFTFGALDETPLPPPKKKKKERERKKQFLFLFHVCYRCTDIKWRHIVTFSVLFVFMIVMYN